jgi:hypothetical protein
LTPNSWTSRRQVARLVRKCLEAGSPVEIDGLGVFQPEKTGGYRFVPETKQKVFIAYVLEDLPIVQTFYDTLAAGGFDPWLDKRKLLPGQNWPRAIENAIEVSDFFLACFSRRGISKRGHFHSELRYALDCASRLPLDQVFFIPVRLDDCPVPPRIARQIQYVDLFPDFQKGIERVCSVMRRQIRQRAA